jgi:uncharacterized protein (TIGR03382 family)
VASKSPVLSAVRTSTTALGCSSTTQATASLALLAAVAMWLLVPRRRLQSARKR